MEKFINPDNITYPHFNAFFTTKSLNGNLKEIAKNIGISENRIYIPMQKHTDKVIVLDDDLSPKIGDAVITKEKGVLIGVQVADCVPVILCDIRKHVIGAVHAGWRGTADEILKKTIFAMTERFYSTPEDIMLAIGPSIRWCCYHVGYDVLESVIKTTGTGEYHMQKGETYCLDLATANKYQAMSMGVPQENIWMSNECTFCYPERFYSYRYAKGPTGRQGGFIGILT